MLLAAGQTLTHYEILGPLGAGGMGEVYRAKDTRLDREVAIKVLPEELADDEERLRRFEREAKTLASLNHPNVAGIHGIDQQGDTCFLAMELVAGEDLAAKLARGALPLDEAVDVCCQIATGLEAAHEAGVVHRDLKPANVRVTPDGVVKILDFGLAKPIHPRSTREGASAAESDGFPLTEEGLVLGTPTYMSPEQARGKPVDQRTDVWAFGCVLYECLTGRRAFGGASLNDVLAAVAGDEPDASRLPARTPAFVRRLLKHCLAKDPGRRLATIVEARTALERRRLAPRVLTLGVVGIAAVLVAVYWLGRSSSPETTAPPAAGPAPERPVADPDSIAVMPFTVRGGDELAYLGSGLADLLGVKLDGAGSFKTVDPHAVTRQVGGGAEELDPEAAAEVAAGLGAGRFVLGTLVEVGGFVQISSTLYSSGDSDGSGSHGRAEGRVEDVFALVDTIATQLLVGLSGGPESAVQRVAGVTTDSLPAFKAYMDGEADYRRGEYQGSLEHFQRALEIDPDFALAYYRLSTAAEWAWDEQLIYSAAERAVELAGRLPERERQLVQVLGVRRREANEEAETVLRSFVGTYPNDLEAWANLGELVNHTRPMHGGSFLEAREIWDRVLGIDPAHPGALLHVTRMDAYERRLDDVDARLGRFHELFPDADRRIEMDVLTLAVHGDPASDALALERLEGASDQDHAIGVWNAAVYAGNLALSIELCERMTRPESSIQIRRLGYAWLASLQYARGRLGAMRVALAGLAEADALAAAELRPIFLSLPLVESDDASLVAARDDLESQTLPEPRGGAQLLFQLHDDIHPILRAYALGRLAILRGRTDEVLARADELDGLRLEVDHERLAQDLALALRGHQALATDDPEAALRSFEAMRMSAWHGQTLFSPFYARTAERFARAEALAAVGQDDEALRWYGNLAQNSPFEVAYGPPALLRRAELHARRGERAQAVELYRELIEQWKDGDPEVLAVVETARSRVKD